MVRIDRRFQLESEKLGRKVVFQVTVYEKKNARKDPRYFAQTECEDPYHYRVQFIIKDSPSFEALLDTFIQQLNFRGYTPLRYRIKSDKGWSDWIEIPPIPR